MTDPFASPASANGIKWADVKGALVLIDVQSVEQKIQTAFGESDAIRADVFILDGASAGDEYRDCLIFPKALQSQLRPNVGKRVLGRVIQGSAKSGQSAPWLLQEASDADKAVGVAFISKTAITTPAGGKPPF
jgi:hypothetical protein